MTKFRLANQCQNKESKQKKHDKSDNPVNPVKPLTSYSAQINFYINILNGSCLAMHGQYILYLVSKERGKT